MNVKLIITKTLEQPPTFPWNIYKRALIVDYNNCVLRIDFFECHELTKLKNKYLQNGFTILEIFETDEHYYDVELLEINNM